MDSTILWDDEEPVTGLSIEVPAWIDQDVSPNDIAAIVQGGCASGAYMPAVTYHQARETMSEHGDDVFQYLDDRLGLDQIEPFRARNAPKSWSQLACFYLSTAVELWAGDLAESDDFIRKVAERVTGSRWLPSDEDESGMPYTNQEAYDHDNPPLPDDPMETER